MNPGRRRRILVDARTPVHYAMFAPVLAVLALVGRARGYKAEP